MRLRAVLISTSALAISFSWAAQSLAQQADASQSKPNANQVSEVVVTATRRAEKLQAVPLSITAVTAAEIAQTGAIRFQDINALAPNVLLLQNSGAPTFENVSIRGIDGRAGIYVDDVPIADSSGYNTYLIDAERIEVLRGPQGTLFGTNNLAGTINTITKTPTNKFEAMGEFDAGDYDQLDARAYVAGPLIEDKLFASLSAAENSREGFEKIREGGRGDDDEGFGGRFKLVAKPTSNFTATLSLDADITHVHPYYYKLTQDLGAPPSPLTLDPNIHDREVDAGPQRNESNRKIYGGSLKLQYDLNGYTLTSITAQRSTYFSLSRDGDYSAANMLYDYDFGTNRQVSQELRITSPDLGRFRWLAGFFYLDDNDYSLSYTFVGPDYPIAPGVPLSAVYPFLGLTVPYIPQYGLTSSTNDDKQYAGYVNANLSITNQFIATAGVRYTSEAINLAVAGLTPYSTTESNFSPTGSLTYKFTPGLSVYGTISEGWYRGGFNTAPVITYGARAFKPEELVNYEAGVKSEWLDNRLLFNADIFYEDYSNLQRTQSFIINNVPVSTTTNAAKTHSYGAEVELQARPIHDLSLTLRGGYENATYASYPNAPVYTATGEQTLNLAGEPLPFAPKWSGTLEAEYRHPVGASLYATAGGQVTYQSAYQLNSGPLSIVPFFAVTPTTILNLNAGLHTNDGRYEIDVIGRNITNEVYKTGLDITTYATGGRPVEADQFSDPATYMVQFKFHY